MNPRLLILLAHLCGLLTPARGVITVNGIGDEDIENDRATFEVPSEAGFTIEASLNEVPVALDTSVEISTAGYYELSVTKTNDSDQTEESTLIKFIVVDSSRGSSERGLTTWVPYPTIDSDPAAFQNARLDVVTPTNVPVGFGIPLITRLRDLDSGNQMRLNGTVEIPETAGTSIPLLRGFGSGFLDAQTKPGPLVLTPTVAGITQPLVVQVEPTTDWTQVSSDILSSASWENGSRIHVTSNFTIGAGATLTIGPDTIVQLDPGIDIEIEGALVINGTTANPVYFTHVPGRASWGGFFLRQTTSVVNATGAIFTGSGADDRWFNGSGYSVHRDEQATFLIDTPQECSFTDCFFIDLPGQALHGRNAIINLTDSLVQRVPTVGQFNGGRTTVTRSAFIEFPLNTESFTDDDNDGIYFTAGSHQLIESVIGWAKDDGVDAGSGSSGEVTVADCWFEACYHEGMAWSGQGRTINVSGTVAMNCGQGIEAGWSGSANNNSPIVNVTGSLSIGNHVGWRFGDNYTWDYDGQLNVSSSLSLYNDRNVWGMEWDSWTYRSDKMNIENNHLSTADDRHPNNSVWDGGTDAGLLIPFSPAADKPVGCGFAEWHFQKPLNEYESGITLCLSEFGTLPAAINYEIVQDFSTIVASGTVEFSPGEIRKAITLPPLDGTPRDLVQVTLTGSTGSTITTPRNLVFIPERRNSGPQVLIPAGATWRYLDDGSDQGTAWSGTGFDAASWAEGSAQLGYGDGDEATVISFGSDSSNKHATTYFRHTFTAPDPSQFSSLRVRLVRDDGAIVYLNGDEEFRSNIDPGPISFDAYTGNVAPGGQENNFYEQVIPAPGLLAGENTIAVEVHQANASSSDLSFDLELLGERPSEIILLAAQGAGETILVWQGDEGDTLQTSTSLETGWVNLPDAVSPMVVRPNQNEPVRFYRIVR